MKETKTVEFGSDLRFEAEYVDGKFLGLKVSGTTEAVLSPDELVGLRAWLARLSPEPYPVDKQLQPYITYTGYTQAVRANQVAVPVEAETEPQPGDIKFEDYSKKLPQGGVKVTFNKK